MLRGPAVLVAPSRARSKVDPGALIAGRYEVVRPLGTGAMGSVLEAIDCFDGTAVAIKLLHAELASDAAQAQRFIGEGQALSRLEHPAIVRVRSCGPTQDGGLYLAMDLLRGETLQRFLRRRGQLSIEVLGPIVRDLALGLHYAHEHGVVHRDVKPSNVMLVPGRDPEAPIGATLIDFGVATSPGAARLTQAGDVIGTPRYMAPEQLAGTAAESARADLYALGILAYEALAGESPFPCDAGLAPMLGAVLRGELVPLRSRRADVPRAIAQVIARATALQAEHRFASTLEMLAAWDEAVRPLERGAPATIPMPITSVASVHPTRPGFVAPRSSGTHRIARERRSVDPRRVIAATVALPSAEPAIPPRAGPVTDHRIARTPPRRITLLQIAVVIALAILSLSAGVAGVLALWALLG